MDRSYTTDLKVRGYLSSRLPDEFPIVSSIREDNRMIGNRRLEDAGRQRVQGHESPSVFISPSFRRPWCMGRLYTTDLKVRGYLNSRLPDEFSNSDTNLFVRGCEKDTKSKPIQPHLFRMVSR